MTQLAVEIERVAGSVAAHDPNPRNLRHRRLATL